MVDVLAARRESRKKQRMDYAVAAGRRFFIVRFRAIAKLYKYAANARRGRANLAKGEAWFRHRRCTGFLFLLRARRSHLELKEASLRYGTLRMKARALSRFTSYFRTKRFKMASILRGVVLARSRYLRRGMEMLLRHLLDRDSNVHAIQHQNLHAATLAISSFKLLVACKSANVKFHEIQTWHLRESLVSWRIWTRRQRRYRKWSLDRLKHHAQNSRVRNLAYSVALTYKQRYDYQHVLVSWVQHNTRHAEQESRSTCLVIPMLVLILF